MLPPCATKQLISMLHPVFCAVFPINSLFKSTFQNKEIEKKNKTIKWDRTGWSEGGLGKSLCNWRRFFSQMGYTRLVENRETEQR